MNYTRLIKNATITEESINNYLFQNKNVKEDEEWFTLSYDTYHGKFTETNDTPEEYLDEIERLILEHHHENNVIRHYEDDVDDLIEANTYL